MRKSIHDCLRDYLLNEAEYFEVFVSCNHYGGQEAEAHSSYIPGKLVGTKTFRRQRTQEVTYHVKYEDGDFSEYVPKTCISPRILWANETLKSYTEHKAEEDYQGTVFSVGFGNAAEEAFSSDPTSNEVQECVQLSHTQCKMPHFFQSDNAVHAANKNRLSGLLHQATKKIFGGEWQSNGLQESQLTTENNQHKGVDLCANGIETQKYANNCYKCQVQDGDLYFNSAETDPK